MCVSSRANPFRLRRHFLPAPFAAETDDAALVAGRIDDELPCVVEPVVDELARLVGETEAEPEAAVRERQSLDVEAHCAELLERMAGAGDEQPGGVAELERDAERRARRLAGDAQSERQGRPGPQQAVR